MTTNKRPQKKFDPETKSKSAVRKKKGDSDDQSGSAGHFKRQLSAGLFWNPQQQTLPDSISNFHRQEKKNNLLYFVCSHLSMAHTLSWGANWNPALLLVLKSTTEYFKQKIKWINTKIKLKGQKQQSHSLLSCQTRSWARRESLTGNILDLCP